MSRSEIERAESESPGLVDPGDSSSALGVVVSVGNWCFTIHRRWCVWFARAMYVDLPVSPGMRLRLCSHCRPSEHEVEAYLPSVDIYVNAHGFLGATKIIAVPAPELEP